MVSLRYRNSLLIVAAGLLAFPAWLGAQQALSHVRVVRLSYVEGTVAMLRPGSTEWVGAMANTPIQEGFSISTSADSFAEVEFENGSTARLGELSRIDFTQLALNSEGDRLNHLTVQQGYATFHFVPEHGDVYAVKVANTTLTPHGKSEFRMDFADNQLRVEVFDGSVEVQGPASSTKLGKNKVLEFDTATALAFNVHEGIQKDDWDQWVEARDLQAVLATNEAAVGTKPRLFGWSDLDTYGEWGYFPGYGYGWMPYAPMGWAPYSMGMWSWYSGFGWTWISGEPWGWLPYHYGAWDFDPSMGWFWMPGDFDFWSPCMVTWYGGPGWIGWAPFGAWGAGGVTVVPAGTVQGGKPVNPRTVLPPPPRLGNPTHAPTFAGGQAGVLGGTPLPSNTFLPVIGRTSLGPKPGAASGGPGTRSVAAPRTVLMGGDPSAERAELTAHQGFLRHSPPVLHARLGSTLGGHYPVAPDLAGANASAGLGGSRKGPGSTPGNRSSGLSAPRGGGRSSGAVILSHGSGARASSGSSGGSSGWGSGGSSGGFHSSSSSVSSSGGHSSSGGSSGGGHH